MMLGEIDIVHGLALLAAMSAVAAVACVEHATASLLFVLLGSASVVAAYGVLALRLRRRRALWRPTRDGVALDAVQMVAALALLGAQGVAARVTFGALVLLAAAARVEDAYQRVTP